MEAGQRGSRALPRAEEIGLEMMDCKERDVYCREEVRKKVPICRYMPVLGDDLIWKTCCPTARRMASYEISEDASRRSAEALEVKEVGSVVEEAGPEWRLP